MYNQGINKTVSINNIIRVLFVVYLALSMVFVYSGFAIKIKYNLISIFTAVLICSIVYIMMNKNFIKNYKFMIFFMPVTVLASLFSELYNNNFNFLIFYQAIPFILMPIIIMELSVLHWSESMIINVAKILVIINIVVLYGLNGNALGGWNPNTAILVFCSIIYSLCSLIIKKEKKGRYVYLILNFITIYQTYIINNRSTFGMLIIFISIYLFLKNIYKNISWFRFFYIGVFSINILLPFFFEAFLETKLGIILQNYSLDYFNKSLLNGREFVWERALNDISQHIIIGNGGIRNYYYHNMSLDLLNSFGFVGYVIFVVTTIYFLEKSFNNQKYEYNLYLVGFVLFILLNTFESVFVCTGVLQVFPLILIALPLYLNQSHKIYS